MYPNLYYLVKDLLGLDLQGLKMIQSFGFFVAISFLLCAWVFSKELMRKEGLGLLSPSMKKVKRGGKITIPELLISGMIGLIIGGKVVGAALHFSLFLDDTQSYLLSTTGSLIGAIAGFLIGVFLKYSDMEKERKKYGDTPVLVDLPVRPHEHVGNMTIIAAVSGLLGAKLFDILENLDSFSDDPWGTIFSFSGLTMYGGLIVGSAAVILYAKRNGLTITHVIDACAPGLMLAYGVGRIGCQVAGDGDWGVQNPAPAPSFIPQWMWGYTYPHNVIGAGEQIDGCDGKYCHALSTPVWPTPFYEAVAGILFFFLLWSLRKRITVPGVMFCVYLILNGFERFFIEKIRVNNTYVLFGIHVTQAEIISTVLFFVGIAGVWYFKKQHNKGSPPISTDQPLP